MPVLRDFTYVLGRCFVFLVHLANLTVPLQHLQPRHPADVMKVLSQLGEVLHMSFPPDIVVLFDGIALAALRITLLFDADCLVPGGDQLSLFYAIWWLKILGLPLVLMGCAAMYCTLVSVESWQSAFSLVLFLVYPQQCTAAFSLFNCRALGPLDTQTRLVADATVPCAGKLYTVHATVSCVVCLGLALVPLRFLWGITRPGHNEPALLRLVAAEQGVNEQLVRDAVRDVGRNDRFSFMTAGFRPSHVYWETTDMLRKLTLVGCASLFGKGSLEQLFFTSFVSVTWLALQVKEWPYRFDEDNVLKLSCEVAIYGTALVGLTVHHSDVAHANVFRMVLRIMYFGMVPLCALANVGMKARRAQWRGDDSHCEAIAIAYRIYYA